MKLHNSSFSESFCDICAANKLNRKPPSSQMALRKSSKLELVYSDVRGPMETTSLGGHRYVVSFIDSYSRFARAYFMKHKSEVLEKFRQFCIDEGVPKTFSSLTLRSDGGGEYDNKAFDEFCFAQGIKREMTAPYSPHQNGVAERRWQTVGNMARCLLKQANLPNSFWVRAVDVAFYLTNRCLSGSLPPNKTPFELFYGRKPDLSNLKVFGCSAFRFLEVGVKKLDSKAVKEIFVGYGRTHDSYYLYNPVSGKISHSRNVSFNEKEFLGFGSSFPEDCEFLPEPKSSLDVEEEQVVSSKPLKSVVENDDSRTQETSPVPESSTSNSNADLYAEFRTRSGRHVKTVERYGCPIDNSENVSFVECFSCEAVPNSLEEVKRSQSRDDWLEAMTKEFNSLVDNKTWELCELPAHKKSLGGRWVFALKKDENCEVVKYKGRYVAKGFNQIFGSDYLETFAPTAKLSSIRLLLALATHFHCEVFQFDVSSAYLISLVV